jgi:hypothetical protein
VRIAVAAATIALVCATSCGASPAPTRGEYLAHVSSVCRGYARKLARVPAPADPAAYGDVIASLRRALPLLRAQERAMRGITAPQPVLAVSVGRLLALDRRAITRLEAALAAARRRDAGGVATGLVRFTSDRDQVHRTAEDLGIRCDPN